MDGFTFTDIVGTVGALLVCGAYCMVSWRAIDPESIVYQLVNLVGALMLLISLVFRPNPGAILIESIWAVIAILALLRICWRRGLR